MKIEEQIAKAVNMTPNEVLKLARKWKREGLTADEVRDAFTALAKAKGNKLVWSSCRKHRNEKKN